MGVQRVRQVTELQQNHYMSVKSTLREERGRQWLCCRMVGSEDETWQCKPSAWDSTWLDDVGCKTLMVTRVVVDDAPPLEHGLKTTPAKTLHGLDTPSSEPNLTSKNHPLFPNSFKNSFEYFKVLTLSHGSVVFVTFSSF